MITHREIYEYALEAIKLDFSLQYPHLTESERDYYRKLIKWMEKKIRYLTNKRSKS